MERCGQIIMQHLASMADKIHVTDFNQSFFSWGKFKIAVNYHKSCESKTTYRLKLYSYSENMSYRAKPRKLQKAGVLHDELTAGTIYVLVCVVFWEHWYKPVITMSSLLHIHPPTSTTFAVLDLSDTGPPASCDELSCAWLNRFNSALLVGEITQPLQPLSVCENSFRRGGLDQEMERDCFLCSGKHGSRVSLTPCKQHANTSLKQHLLYPLVNSPARQRRKGM